jgi:hypothetical protein
MRLAKKQEEMRQRQDAAVTMRLAHEAHLAEARQQRHRARRAEIEAHNAATRAQSAERERLRRLAHDLLMEKGNRHIVYGLADPRSMQMKYVGITKCLQQRLEHHHSAANNPQAPVNFWVRELRDEGLQPFPVVLQCIESNLLEELHAVERLWIGRFDDLLNVNGQPDFEPE